MDTQTQIERLIDLAIIQRSELKKLVSELPQLREHLNAEIERVFEDAEPQLRTELEDWTTKQAKDQTAKLGGELEAKIAALSKSLEATTQTRYNAIMAERAQNIDLAKKAEDKLAEVAQAIPVQVKQIVTDELARFPRAGEIDQLRKEFAEPRGLNPRGRWQVGETYNKLDLVSYNGDSYVSNTDGNREKPSRSSEAWTLSAARGNGGAGGGVTSLTDLVAVPANGELLIGNGSAFVNNTLTAGTGVTITNGPGTITIDASGAQEVLTATVTNAESFAITRGQVVYLFGATGNRASVKLANNSADATSAKTFGVVSETSIAAGGTGLITCVGVVDKLMLGAYNDGDTLYLGDTPGSVTATKPYAPNHLVYVGMVERANNGNGELYVKIQNGYELDEIHDVQITTPPLAGSLLMRDATTSLWKANRLTGTANQVTVTNADTSVTLSLPTAIANVNSVTAATTQNLTLAGGSTGASLVLGQGVNGNALLNPAGAGRVAVTAGQSDVTPGILVWDSAALAANIGGGIGFGGAYTGTTVTQWASIRGKKLDGTDGNFGGYLAFFTRDNGGPITERSRISATGNLLIGTTNDSGGERLVVTRTVAAAALATAPTVRLTNATGEGTFNSLHFAGALADAYVGFLDSATAATRRVAIGVNSLDTLSVNGNGNVLIGTTTDGGQKLQVAGTAAFTGAVSTTSTGFSAINASGSVEFLGSRSSTGNGVTVTYKTGATLNWFHGLRGLVDNNWYLFNNSTSTNTLIFDYGTNAATFAGAVAINNTVATAVAVASTHKVTMVIGGVTYYLLASNV